MYNEFQQRLAERGFTSTPLTEAEYNRLTAEGFDDDVIDLIAADIAAGYVLDEILAAYY